MRGEIQQRKVYPVGHGGTYIVPELWRLRHEGGGVRPASQAKVLVLGIKPRALYMLDKHFQRATPPAEEKS